MGKKILTSSLEGQPRGLLQFSSYIPAGAPFDPNTPSTIAGLSVWLDAQDLATITKDGSNNVSKWVDKSTNAFQFVQGTGARQPVYNATSVNSKPGIVFTAASPNNLSMGVDVTYTKFSAFVVVQPTTVARGFVLSGDSDFGIMDLSNGITGLEVWDGTGDVQFADSYSAGTAYRYSIVTNTAPNTCVVTRTDTVLSPTVIDNTNWNMPFSNVGTRGSAGGSGLALNARVGEIIVYNTNISAGNQALIKSYLQTKWGIP